MSSPLIFIKIFEFLHFVSILLFPVSLVVSITFSSIVLFIGAFCFLVIFIVRHFVLGEKFVAFNLDYVHLSFLIYAFAFGLSRFVNSGFQEGINTLFGSLKDYFIFIWPFIFVLREKEGQKIIRKIIFVAAFLAIFYGLLQAIGFDVFDRQINPEKVSGFHRNPYTYAGQLVVFLFFLLNESIYKKNIYFYLALLSCFFCVLNTSERAVIFGILAGIVIFFLIKWKKSFNKIDIFYLSILIIFPLVLTKFINHKFFKKINKLLNNANKNVRFKLWNIAIALWKKNIIFGYGEFPPVYHTRVNDAQGYFLMHAHSVYLELLVRGGLVGLLAFLNLFFSIVISSFKNLHTNKYAICLISIVIAYLIEGIFEYFWGDTEVRHLFLYFTGFVLSFNIKNSNSL